MTSARAGFTLIEILVVLAILGILLALAVPRYTRYIQTLRMREGAQQVVRDLERARLEARRTNTCWTFNWTSSTEYQLQSYVNASDATLPSRDCTGNAGTVLKRSLSPALSLEAASFTSTGAPRTTAYFRPPYGTNYGAAEQISFRVRSASNTSIQSTVTVLGVLGKVIVK